MLVVAGKGIRSISIKNTRIGAGSGVVKDVDDNYSIGIQEKIRGTKIIHRTPALPDKKLR